MTKSSSLFYETFGNAYDPCIILIMGIGAQLIHWPIEFTQGLADKGFYVVTFDNRDAGLSPSYDHLESPYTLEDMASDVITLMDTLEIYKAHIAGISMGGMIAQIFALTYPERALTLTCIASTSGDPKLPPAKPEVLAYFTNAFSSQKPAEDLETWVTNKLALHKIYHHPDHYDEFKARNLFRKTYQRAHHPAGFKRHIAALVSAKPRVEKLKQLSTASLIIHGDYDPVFPLEHGKQLAQILPKAQLEVIENMGHGLPDQVCDKLVDVCSTFYNNRRSL